MELHEDKVIIKRQGALAKMSQGFFKGDKSIYISQISAIQVKPGTMLTNGYIEFTLSGGRENTNGLLDATKDENSVIFTKKKNEQVDRMKSILEDLKSNSSATTTNTTVVQSSSAADEIKKFKDLLDQGIITEAEFESKKKQLLGL